MKNKIWIIVLFILVSVIFLIFYIYQNFTKTNTEYKFEYDIEKEVADVKAEYKYMLENIPKELTINEAIESNFFVYDGMENKTYNENVLDRFIENTRIDATNRVQDEIIIAIYNINGDPIIYCLSYKNTKNIGYVLSKDATRVDIAKTEMTGNLNYEIPDEFFEIVVNCNFPKEYYDIIKKDTGFSSNSICLKSYSKDYKDVEVARYMINVD